MNKFEKQLEKWNNGILRGAQAKLAKCLQVTTATVALWATGKRRPSKGYIAQMARLFLLDEYSVLRLFTSSNDFPDFYSPTPTRWMLRDEDSSSSIRTTAAEETVSLPVFTKMPANYPQFFSQDVNSWWTIPASWAPKTRFLFHLPSKNDPDRLLFVQPCSVWKKGKMMLSKKAHTYKLVRVEQKGTQWVLYPPQGPGISAEQASPVGVVTHCLGKLKITP